MSGDLDADRSRRVQVMRGTEPQARRPAAPKPRARALEALTARRRIGTMTEDRAAGRKPIGVGMNCSMATSSAGGRSPVSKSQKSAAELLRTDIDRS